MLSELQGQWVSQAVDAAEIEALVLPRSPRTQVQYSTVQ